MSDGVWWPEFDEWLRAHGLDSRDLAEVAWRPPHAGVRDPDEDRPQFIEALIYLRNEDGNRYLDPETGEPAIEHRVVPMLHLPAVEVTRYR